MGTQPELGEVDVHGVSSYSYSPYANPTIPTQQRREGEKKLIQTVWADLSTIPVDVQMPGNTGEMGDRNLGFPRAQQKGSILDPGRDSAVSRVILTVTPLLNTMPG